MKLNREKPDYANVIDTRTPMEKQGALASWRAMKTLGYKVKTDVAFTGEVAKLVTRMKKARSAEARGR